MATRSALEDAATARWPPSTTASSTRGTAESWFCCATGSASQGMRRRLECGPAASRGTTSSYGMARATT
eukprot:5677428-Prymnesium_polylepis.1